MPGREARGFDPQFDPEEQSRHGKEHKDGREESGVRETDGPLLPSGATELTQVAGGGKISWNTDGDRTMSSGESERVAKVMNVAEPFDVSTTEHRINKDYRPKFVARGGEHLVYFFEDRPGVVAKVSQAALHNLQSRLDRAGLAPDGALPVDVERQARTEMRAYESRFDRLREYFGRQAVPGMTQALLKVPVTPEMTAALHDGAPPERAKDAKESWALVRIQRRVGEIAHEHTLSLSTGYAEAQEGIPPDAYRRVMDELVDGNETEGFDWGDFDKLLPEQFIWLLDEAGHDPGLRDALRDFTTKAIRYSTETGEALDLVGLDNVAIWKDGDGKWTYRLIDAMHDDELSEALAASAAVTAAAGKPLSHPGQTALLNVVTYTRAINGLARALDLPDRVSLLPKKTRGKIDYLAVLGAQFTRE